MDIFRCAILLSIILLALFVSPGEAQTTTYAVEIEVRQKQLQTVKNKLDLIERKIGKNEALMKDYKKMYFALAKAKGTQQYQVKRDMPPDVAAAAILKNPASHNVSQSVYDRTLGMRQLHSYKPISLSLAGGNFQVRDVYDLLTLYDKTTVIMKTAVPETKRLRNQQDSLNKKKTQLEKEIAALKSGRSIKAADSSILGKWRLTSGNNNSVVEVVRNPNTGTYAGVLRVNRLEFFRQGDTVFVVKPVRGQPGAFTGTEYGYTNSRLPKTSSLKIKISNNQMNYSTQGESLCWIKQAPSKKWKDSRRPLVSPGIDYDLPDF